MKERVKFVLEWEKPMGGWRGSMFALIRSHRRRLRPRPGAPSSALLILGFSIGCAGSGELRGFPLHAGEPLARDQVAFLTGDVQLIDGRTVSDLGRWFELLPGCHVVTTSPESRARIESSASGIIPSNGQLTYAMTMKAGYRYEIQRRWWQLRRSQFLIVSAYEKDPEGAVTQEFIPAASETDLQGCQPPEQTLRRTSQLACPHHTQRQLAEGDTPARRWRGNCRGSAAAREA